MLSIYCLLHLSHSSLPNEGFVQIVTKYSGNKTVCWQSLKNAKNVVCRHLGYTRASSLVNKTTPASVKESTLGSLDCDDGETDLSGCSFTAASGSCSGLFYIKC